MRITQKSCSTAVSHHRSCDQYLHKAKHLSTCLWARPVHSCLQRQCSSDSYSWGLLGIPRSSLGSSGFKFAKHSRRITMVLLFMNSIFPMIVVTKQTGQEPNQIQQLGSMLTLRGNSIRFLSNSVCHQNHGKN